MALVGRGVVGGSDIEVLVDPGADGDMQIVKLAYSALGTETLVSADASGLLVNVGAAPTNATTTALDNDGPVVKASAGVLYGFQGYCDAAGFVQVHNKASAPTSSNVPVIVIPIASGAAFSLDLGVRGRSFSTGIAFGFSSVGPTYTDGGSHLWVDAQYT